MAIVSLWLDLAGLSAEDLIASVNRGIHPTGDRSWSIDLHYYDFQFTGQGLFGIENGRSAGQLSDVAYQAMSRPTAAPTPSTAWRPSALATRPGTNPTMNCPQPTDSMPWC